ncbi:DUF2779 domain-containing protein [Chloroflexota bacterium]
MTQLLSKTKYLNGRQCLRYLWVLFNDPKRVPTTDVNTQYIFDQGHVVGELAKQLFPDGINVPQGSFRGNIDQTLRLMKDRKPLFEAGILADNLYSRVDVLYPADDEAWDIIEVKSSTSVKDVHIQDAAYQRYCCTQLGLNIRKCYVALINNQYFKDGEIDPESLFNIHDITEEVLAISDDIPNQVEEMYEAVDKETCPEMIIGPHCRDPYECPLEECWEHLPEGNIFTLYYSGKKSFDLYDRGIMSIQDIPDDYKLSEKQVIQKEALITGVTHMDKEAIKDFLASLEYPLYYMDFETINPAVPLFDGTRPYQQVPFQFSVHVVKGADSAPEHSSFLAESTQDPRPKFLKELRKVLGNSGSIVAYNKGFEEGILKDLGKAFPEYEDWVNQIISRMVDLLAPFRNFDYYNPSQKGSASLKSVLPAVTGKGYEELDIADGQLASMLFEKITYSEVSDEEKNKVRSDLEKYCALDTEGMIWIVEKLRELVY